MIILILLLGMFGPISTDMYLSALPTMVVELSTNESTLNITMYGFILGMALSILLLGPLTDRFGRRVPLILSMVEYTATTLACAFVEDIHILKTDAGGKPQLGEQLPAVQLGPGIISAKRNLKQARCRLRTL